MGRKNGAAFSARIDEALVTRWRAYAKVSGMTLTKMTEEAMNEYIDNHPLTGFKANVFNSLIGRNRMTVREWIEETAYKAIEFEEERHGRIFSESDKQAYVNNLVDDCASGWDAGDDPNADDEETRFWRDRTIDYCEEKAEEIYEDLASQQDELMEEQEEEGQ